MLIGVDFNFFRFIRFEVEENCYLVLLNWMLFWDCYFMVFGFIFFSFFNVFVVFRCSSIIWFFKMLI